MTTMAPHGTEISCQIRKRIVTLHKKGHSYQKISNALEISRNTVAKVIQRFKKNGEVLNMKRSGRPRKLTPRDERHLGRSLEKNRKASTVELAKALESQVGVTVSTDTIRRTVHRMGLYGYRPRRKPLLQPRHKQDRMAFATTNQSKDVNFWNKVLWSDETKINRFGSDGIQWVWRRPGDENEKCMVPTVKHGGGSVLLWGCMSSAGVGELHFIDGIMDSNMYCHILKEKMLPSLHALGRGAIFQQDNDPKHTSKFTTEFLTKHKVKKLDWPSMSPDLNPIEHLWGVLKRKVEQHRPKSINALKEVILEEWRKIDASVCLELVHSMPRRIDAVLRNKGGHTKY